MIAAYEVSQSGDYSITNSLIEHPVSSCSAYSNGGEVRVYVNDTQSGAVLTYDKETTSHFNRSLGTLSINDTVYVAVGPNGTDGCDGFELDFSLEVQP